MQKTQVKDLGRIEHWIISFLQLALVIDYAFSVTLQFLASAPETVMKISYSVMSFFRMISSLPLILFRDVTSPTIHLDLLDVETAESVLRGNALISEWSYAIFGAIVLAAIIYFLEVLKQVLTKIREEGVYSQSVEKKFSALFSLYVVIQGAGYLAKLIFYSFIFSQLLRESPQSDALQILQAHMLSSIPWVGMITIGIAAVALLLYKRTVTLKEDNLLTI